MTWDVSEGGYTAEQLRAAFAAHGGVADVVLRESKRRSKGSALVVMPSLAAAAAAAASANGRPGAPLLVVPFSKARFLWLLALLSLILILLSSVFISRRQLVRVSELTQQT